MRSLLCLFLGLLLTTAAVAQGVKPFTYTAGKDGKGELKFVGNIPVLVVEGTPAEMGKQIGKLAAGPAAKHPKPNLFDFPRDYFRHEAAAYLRQKNKEATDEEVKGGVVLAELFEWPKFQALAAKLEPNFPKDQLAELKALIEAGGLDRKQITAANGMFDLGHAADQLNAGCSSVVIPAKHGGTGHLLFGRNLDFFHFGYLHQYSLLTVYRPGDKTKRRFVSAGFPGLVGSFTGMNDAGLTIASHDVLEPNTTTKFNPKGVPFAMAYRRVLEECATVDDAVKLLKGIERASITSLVIADPKGGAVIEVTPNKLAVRYFKDAPGVCTNHFCEMANPDQQNLFATKTRFDNLNKAVAVTKDKKFGIDDVKAQMGFVDLQDEDKKTELTIQTFVFEPATRTVHVGFGDGKTPATKGKLTKVELKELWGK